MTAVCSISSVRSFRPSTTTWFGATARCLSARRIASTLACRMLKRSISRTDAAPMPTPSAFAMILPTSFSRCLIVSCLESFTPGIARFWGGMTTAQATTGPARGPRPTSSIPAIRGPCSVRRSRSIVLQRMDAVPLPADVGLLFRSARRRHDDTRLLFLNAHGLAGELTQVVQLRPTHAPATQHRDVRDHGAVNREDTLDTNAIRDLANRKGLADAAAATRDTGTLERLNALLVAFLDAYVHAERVARAKGRQVGA